MVVAALSGTLAVQAQLSGIKDGDLTAVGSIAGELRVPQGSDRSLAGVVVRVMETDAASAVDANGRYAIEGVRPGTYTLVAAGEGFSRLKITDVTVQPNRRVTLAAEEIPMVLRDGEVQRLETLVVSATKQVETLERVNVTETRPRPFTGGNVDLPRTIDDAQPYYVFDRSVIERSGATTVEELVRGRIPMSVTKASAAQLIAAGVDGFSSAGNATSINLSGLGPGSTLIMVNGRRVPQLASNGVTNTPSQADVNGIPLGAIERIEILPAAGSAIHGGGATGGAMNIILRHDFRGGELGLTYENVYGGDAPIRQASLVLGETFDGGRTHLLFTLSHTEAEPVRYGDRQEVVRGFRDRAWANDPRLNPATSTSALPLGSTPNIRAVPTQTVVNGQLVVTPGALFGPGSSDRTFVPVGYAGGGGLVPLAANAGQFNWESPEGAQGLPPFYGLEFPLGKSVRIVAGELHLRRRFGDDLELFVELSNSENRSRQLSDVGVIDVTIPAGAATNPFGTAVRVYAPIKAGVVPTSQRMSHRRGTAGFKLGLPAEWIAEGDVTVVESTLARDDGNLDMVGLRAAAVSGAFDVFKDLLAHPPNLDAFKGGVFSGGGTTLGTANMRAAGPTWPMPAGDVWLAMGAGYQEEVFREGAGEVTWLIPRPGVASSPYGVRGTQRNAHFYAEMHLPLVSKSNALPAIRELDMQFAARTERYFTNDFGDPGSDARFGTSNVITGLRYRPIPDVLLRAHFGAVSQPPLLNELNTLPPPFLGLPFSKTGWLPISIPDPKRGGELTSQAEVSFGGNPKVRPASGRSVGAGVVLEPRFVPGLRVSLDYTCILRRNLITTVPWEGLVAREDRWPERVVRGPAPPGDPFGVGPITFVDGTAMNLASERVENYNFALSYRRRSGRTGDWEFFAMANSWQHRQRKIVPPDDPWLEFINGAQHQAKFTGNGGLHWSRNAWSAGWTMRFIGSHRLQSQYHTTQGGDRVESQIFHDVHFDYTFDPDRGERGVGRWLSGLTIQVGAKNVFNTAPAFDGSQSGEYFSRYGDLRMGSYYMTLRKKF